MKVFLSWTGTKSKLVAEAIHEWLPNVIQAVSPWLSAADIDKGARWSADMAAQLEEARVGIICLTSENLEASWIHFEAGALSKTLDKTYVCPYLFGLEPADIKGPLVQFQAARANKEDTLQLVQTINQAVGENGLPEMKLLKAFDVWWPQLEEKLDAIAKRKEKSSPKRSDRELLEELLELARGQAREAVPDVKESNEWMRAERAQLRFQGMILQELQKQPGGLTLEELMSRARMGEKAMRFVLDRLGTEGLIYGYADEQGHVYRVF